MTLEQLIESINSRKAFSPFGISTAAAYVGGIAPCLTGGDLCPVKIFKLASADLWEKEIKEAANRLTYCDNAMADPDLLSKSIRDGAGITKDAVLEYDCVLSSCMKDRDGDIVRQKGGLEVDLKMPLLWQHIQVSPIGKHVALLEQDDTITKSRFAIADTELGRDAAVLVKFGALRKSIGFKPFEFSPIEIVKGSDGKDHVRGWDVKKSACMEGSLVSIPANPAAGILSYYEKEFDGLCTAHGRGLLKHPMVKHWSKGIYDLRPVQVPGVDLSTKAAESETTAKLTIGGAVVELSTKSTAAAEKSGQAQGQEKRKCPKCGVGRLASNGECPNCFHIEVDNKPGSAPKSTEPTADKAVTDDLSTKMMGNEYIDGSYEKVQSMLRATARSYLRGKGLTANENGYTDLVATFGDSAVVCLYSYGDVKSPCYRIDYSVDKSGAATWTGEPKSVEVKQQIIDKRFAAESIDALSRKLAAKMLNADGANEQVRAAHDTISKAFATLKQSSESFDFEELFSN
jgi:hypothetical protein